MALDRQQLAIARQLIALAEARGLSPARAREFAAAAYSESGLRPRATNSKSGAAGLYQLLSSGYRKRAMQLGGLYNPRANAQAILPDYVAYWRSHPNALPGEAGRDVERSGEGASFYSKGLPLIPTGGGTPPAAPVEQLHPTPEVSQMMLRLAAPDVLGSMQDIIEGDFDPLAMLSNLAQHRQEAIREARAAAQAAGGSVGGSPSRRGGQVHEGSPTGPAGSGYTGLAEAFYDPIGQYDNGRFSSEGIGGHSDHVHLSITNPKAMLAAIKHAQGLGLHVGENPYVDKVDPVHVSDSFHYRTFSGKYDGRKLGQAIDVSGSPDQMAAFFRWAVANLKGSK